MTPSQKLSKFQNKVRGKISQRKNQNVYDGKSLNASNEKLKRDINEILILSRAVLEPSQFLFFIKWTNNQVENQIKDYSIYYQKSYADVAGLFKNMPEVEWEKEVVWVIERLKFDSDKLNKFYNFLIVIEKLAYEGRQDDILNLLDSFELENGASLWSIQLKISFEQIFNGLVEQKKWTNTFRKKYKTGLLSYLTFFISSRNEIKTNYVKFIEDTEKTIAAHKYYKKNSKLLNYLNYKILGKYPEDKDLKDLLLIEQAHSIYDLYDTFINIIQYLIINGKENLLDSVSWKIKELEVLEDYRIVKIIEKISGKKNENIVYRNYDLFSVVVNEDTSNERIYTENGIDIWGIFNTGYSLYENEFYNPENLFEQTISGFLNFTKYSYSSANIINQFNKHVLNFNILPSVKGLSYFLKPLNDKDVSYFFNKLSIDLNSPLINYYSVEDELNKQSGKKHLIEESIDLLNSKKYGSVYSILIKLLKSEDEFFKNYALHSLIKLSYLDGDIKGILDTLKSIDISFLKNYESFIFKKILKVVKYTDLLNIDNPLDRANISYICLLNNDDGNLLASLRLNIKDVCVYYNVSKPSEIYVNPSDKDLINFLSEVCVPSNLDMCRLKSLRGSKLVIEERIEICGKLRVIDRINSDKYEHELSRLHYLNTLEEGQKVLSSSRIYVDIESFKKWGMHEIAGEISRYKDLAEILPDENVQYIDLIQGLYTDENYLSSFIPESDADLLLLSILRRCEYAFLFNSNWGLDYYLSKRIRHQSFIGRLRNELEQSGLITTKVSEKGNYQDNQFWIDYLCEDYPEFKVKLQKVFKNFSASFDKNLLDLKDNKLHIKSNDKPEGMLNLNIPANYIPVLRYIMDQDDYDSIFTSLIDILWNGLSHSLKLTRNYIITDLSKQISTLFDSLKFNIKKQLGSDLLLINDKYLELDQKITTCNSSIQAVLIEIGNWFTRNEIEAHSKYISPIEMIDLAINTASKSLNKNDIVINNNVEIIENPDIEFMLSLSNLPIFNDIFFILLDNVQEHSYLHNPEVYNNVIFDCKSNLLEIEFINTCHSRSKIKNFETVERIKNEIKSKSIIRSREEGNSGLIKLAAAEDNGNVNIEFGYNTDKSFRVKLLYPIIRTNTLYDSEALD